MKTSHFHINQTYATQHKLYGKQCRSWSASFFRSWLIWNTLFAKKPKYRFRKMKMIQISLRAGHLIVFRWHGDDGLTLNAGLVALGIRTSIAKKPYIFVIFQRGSWLRAPSRSAQGLKPWRLTCCCFLTCYSVSSKLQLCHMWTTKVLIRLCSLRYPASLISIFTVLGLLS